MAYTPGNPLRRWLGTTLMVVVAIGLLLYPVDWALWRLRMAVGGGMGTVTVTSMTAANLKGNHFEVYSTDTVPVDCSRSLLPQAGAGACWWLRRHPQQITQY